MASKLSDDTTADQAAQLFASEIKGKNVIITGVSPRSIASEIVKALAAHDPGLLVITGRSQQKMDTVIKEVKDTQPHLNIRSLTLVLDDLSQVRKAAQEVLDYKEAQIDVLINSAGIMATDYSLTKDGFESQIGVCHFGHFLFTQLILPKLFASPAPRVVNVSSDGHGMGGIRYDDMNFGKNGENYDPWAAYAQAKTANVLHAVALSDHYHKDHNLSAFSLQPGATKSGLFDSLTREKLQIFIDLGATDENFEPLETSPFKWKTLEQCAATPIVAAFRPDIVSQSGSYLRACQVTTENVNPLAIDKDNAERFFELSNKLVGL